MLAGRLEALTPPLAPVWDGQGPRHYDYHPHLPVVYFSNENSSTVSAYALDGVTGQLTLLDTWSTLPEGFVGSNTCAQIHVHPAGEWLYVSNRGHDSLAIFRMDSETGLLQAAGHRLTEPTPRAFGVDPTGRFVYVAGLGSNALAAYRVTAGTGELEPIGRYPLGQRPMWVLPIQLS